MKILIVDDNPENLDMLEFLLKSSSYEVQRAKNGKEAIEILGQTGFDMIISDILMPVMDGFQLCKRCQEDEKLSKISFIFYSATYIDDKDIEFALSLGAQRFLIKPQEPQEILRIVAEVANQAEERGQSTVSQKKLDEKEVYKLYSERLVNKLEEKVFELEEEIANKKKVEAELMASEERFLLAVDGSTDGIWDWDIHSGNAYFSPRWKSMIGYAEGEIFNTYDSFTGLLHESDREALEKKLGSYLNHEIDDFECEFRMKCKDGSYKWILARGKALFAADGKPFRMAGSHTDITERKHQLEELNKLSNAVNFSPVLVVIFNSEGLVEYVNPQYSAVTGYEPGEVIGRKYKLFDPELASTTPFSRDEIWEVIRSGQPWKGELELVSKEGRFYWESVLIAPILDSNGRVTHFVAVGEDVSSKKNYEQELISARDHAEESDRLKSAFLANMSHEIRTPMNGILGFAELLKDGLANGDDIAEYITIIERSGRRMLSIINDLIEISKVESAQVNVHIEEVNLNELLDYTTKFFMPNANQKNLRLVSTNCLSEKESIILTDREKVLAILTNLMKNAIKYTDSGRVELGCRVTGGFIEFYVLDTGVGIEESKQASIFERFVQADTSLSSQYEGAGLGLSIARAYVEMLGGEIRVESSEGKGAVFFFTLPFIVPSEKSEKGKDSAANEEDGSDRGLTLLIAEDDEFADMLISRIIRKICYKVFHANNGEEAVRICREHPEIDMILMDMKMPIKSGFDATREIRAFNSKVTIIAQTAYSMPGDRERALDAGCNDYIAKPIINEKLLEIIKKYRLPI